jgi:hypothetical protein
MHMANDPSALATHPDSPSEDEYQTFLRALSETARGRAFLAEHARRSRSDENATLLSSVQRLEGLVRSQTELPPPEPVGPNPFDEVRDVLETIREKQEAFDPGALTAQIGMLADMIESVHRRIDTLAVPAPVAAPVEEEVAPAEDPAPPGERAIAPADEPVTAETAFAEPEPEAAAEDLPAETVADRPVEPEIETAIDAVVEAEPEAALEVEPEAAPAEEPTLETMPEAEPVLEPVAPDEMPLDAAVPAKAEAETQIAAEAESPVAPLDMIPAEQAVPGAPAEPEDATEQSAEAAAPIPEVAWDPGEPVAGEAVAPAAPAPGLAITALVETLVAPKVEEPAPEARIIKAGTIPPPAPFAGEDFATGKRARVMPPPVDPLADIKAMSEEERIALFT